MPTIVTKTVKASGGHYSSLAGWSAGQQGDLREGTGNDTVQEAECHAFVDTTICDIDGWITDATHYIRVYTHSSARHAGVWDEAKYVIQASNQFQHVLILSEGYTRIEGLQVRNTHASAVGAMRIANEDGSNSDVRIEKTIARVGGTGGTGDGIYVHVPTALTIRNCVIYDTLQAIRDFSFASDAGGWAGQTVVQNCTLIAGSRGLYRNGDATITATNCYAGGAATADYSGTMTLANCASSDATGSPGRQNIAVSSSAGAYFVDVTSGSENFHLQTSSLLLGPGANLSASFTDDIDGQTRTRWDLGADEVTSVQDLPVPQICC